MSLSKYERARRKSARKAVERGVAVLDARMPTWFKKITLKTLDLADGCNCIAGQLALRSRAAIVVQELRDGYSGYASFTQYLARSENYYSLEWNNEHGFTVMDAEHSFKDLDREWARVIRRKLREAEAAQVTS